MQDSAGVRLVRHDALIVHPEPWQLGAAEITVGAQDQPSEHSLFRVVSAHRFLDGRLVIANAGTHELRFFDARGRFTHAVGGEGEGPGEFGRLQWMQARAGDTLVVFDGGHGRLVEFTPNGEYIRTVRLESTDEARLPIPIIVFPHGEILAEVAVRMRAEATQGIERSSAPLFRYERDGAYAAPVGTYPGVDVWIGLRPSGTLGRAAPFFGKTTRFHRAGGDFVVADNAIAGFDTYSWDGQLQVRVRWESGDRIVPSGAADEERNAMLEAISDLEQRRVLAPWYARVPAAVTLPAFENIVVSGSGEFWVQEYALPQTDGLQRWLVFSPDGVYHADVQIPNDLRLLQITSEMVVGLTRDDDDVELVQVRRLRREAG